MTFHSLSTSEPFAKFDRICREKERRNITGVSSVQWWRNERSGKVPRRISIGIRSVGWRMSELQAWVRGEWSAPKASVAGEQSC